MPRVQLSAGTVDYLETGGTGPVLVFTHGLLMNATQWRKVVPLLDGYRCVRPTLRLGAHRQPMSPDADLSERGVALPERLVEALTQFLTETGAEPTRPDRTAGQKPSGADEEQPK